MALNEPYDRGDDAKYSTGA
jgi:hypothetical protein